MLDGEQAQPGDTYQNRVEKLSNATSRNSIGPRPVDEGGGRVCVRLLGPLAVSVDGVERALPASRKVRALLAFLAVAPASVTRSRLCELLWDVPNDPRGELRWSLSKLRSVLDAGDRRRIVARGDALELDLTECDVDALTLARAMRAGVGPLDTHALRELEAQFVGDFAEGLAIDRNPEFESWLGTQRRQFREFHVAVLEKLVDQLADQPSESFRYLEKWLQLAPYDVRPHELLLNALLRAGRVREAEDHFSSTTHLFEAEGLDWLPIREAWKAARQRATSETRVIAVPDASRQSPTPPDDVSSVIAAASPSRRASICVMPFVDRTSASPQQGGFADGLTEDLITRLARLRVLFVIARGSVFALGARNIPPEEAARLLNVDYVASGSVRRQGNRISVNVELAEARAARIVWVDEFTCSVDDSPGIPDEIGNRIVASLAREVEMSERNRAMLRPPSSLNAWEAYHRGLWHMYRFNGDDNVQAAHFFKVALAQDRTFARAHACLSFTHFQNAFLHHAEQRDREIALAYETAGESLIADDHDPAAHWAMGRALWLRGDQAESLIELERSVALSPNFALGHYTLGFVHCQSGDSRLAIASTDYSRHLSPFDPLLFAMFAARGMALLRLGRYEEAAEAASKAAARPNAHIHIQAIAATCLASADRLVEAQRLYATLRARAPDYQFARFLSAFRFPPDVAEIYRRNAARIGFV
jgi:DNA-binding SARP family transcriptional activator/TolB-like protein